VPALVHAGLRRLDSARDRLQARYDRGQLSGVEYRHAHAALFVREARWWAVLARDSVADHALPVVYITAVTTAECAAVRWAQHWAQAADDHARLTATDRVG